MIIEVTLPLMGSGTMDDTWEALDVGNLLDPLIPCTVYMDEYDPVARICKVRIEAEDNFVQEIAELAASGHWAGVALDMKLQGLKSALAFRRLKGEENEC